MIQDLTQNIYRLQENLHILWMKSIEAIKDLTWIQLSTAIT